MRINITPIILITESTASYQRNRLKALDNGLILLITISSFFLTAINLLLGTKYAISVLPLLIPVLIFPLVEGVIVGTIIKDSLKWRTRGWLYFITGIIFVPFEPIAIYLIESPIESPNFLFGSVLYFGYGFLAFPAINRFRTMITDYFESNFDSILVSQDIDYSFLHDGYMSAFVIALGTGGWSMALLGSNSIPIPLFLVPIFGGINIWVLSCLGVEHWVGLKKYRMLQLFVMALLLVIAAIVVFINTS